MTVGEGKGNMVGPMDFWSYRHVQVAIIGMIFALQLFAVAIQIFGLADQAKGLSWFFFIRQDVLILAVVMAGILLLKPEPIAKAGREPWLEMLQRPGFIVLFALLLIGICWAGHYLILLGHDLSRDEQMANFDAYIFSHGKLFWPIPEQWRPYADALNQTFILPIGDHEAWVSAYLPVNAAMRAAVGMIADPALTSPLLVGVGALALWRVSLRLWPDSGSARAVALILYAGSSQVILTGMTAYAMTAHLALNLVWLALFLQDRRASHVGAILIGFLATGLHQPIFHPLFVLPFMWLLFQDRRWRLMLLYGIGYGLICVFWLAWPVWISSHGIGQVPAQNDPGIDYLSRLLKTVPTLDIQALWLMTLNLLRFVTWQHMLLLPLLAFGLRAAWRGDAIARALAVGLLLPIAVMLILLPYQGHGWGYRYLHGVIGNACLLGAYGWRSLDTLDHPLHRTLLWTSGISFLLLLPTRAWMAHKMVKPYAEVSEMINRSGADVAIIEDRDAPFAQDLVINRPDLSSRPLRFAQSQTRLVNMHHICKNRKAITITFEEMVEINKLFMNREKLVQLDFDKVC